MIICVGEILADMIGGEKNGRVVYTRYAGGAPFNVACNLRKLGSPCGFFGCLGEDIIGNFLSDFAYAQEFDYLTLARSNTRDTTLAFVELQAGGERKFSFFRKNTADYALPLSEIKEIVSLADIVHLGSLMLSEKEGVRFAEKLVCEVRAAGKLLSFDVNYREDIFPNRSRALSVYKPFIDAADIVKFSEEELSLFAEGEDAETRLQNVGRGKTATFVTLGSAGSMVFADGEIYQQRAPKIKPIDTTGAGDAFFAGVLGGMASNEKRDWRQILQFGNTCGALTACGKGAIDAFPTVEKIAETIRDTDWK